MCNREEFKDPMFSMELLTNRDRALTSFDEAEDHCSYALHSYRLDRLWIDSKI
jgi:hypothetical protein